MGDTSTPVLPLVTEHVKTRRLLAAQEMLTAAIALSLPAESRKELRKNLDYFIEHRPSEEADADKQQLIDDARDLFRRITKLMNAVHSGDVDGG